MTKAQAKMYESLKKHRTLYPPSGRASGSWWCTADSLTRLGLASTNGYVINLLKRV